jgi:predicted CXXCH cytochrome family protein
VPPAKRPSWLARILLACLVIALPLVVAQHRRASAPPPDASGPAAPEVAFAGEAACASCHPREAAAWHGSHHQLAMQPASPTTVLGDFSDATFTHAGVTSRLVQRDGKYLARTDGPDGNLHDYPIAYTFGVAPLQQYLVPLPGGRLQALEIAWDSRPAAAGGQRWFHLYPDEKLEPGDPLHWTAPAENWNFMCADCHSTHVRKGYDPRSAGYTTRFAELPVSCEACHGPGARHIAWAKEPPDRRRSDGDRRLSIALDERRGVVWSRDPASGKPHRSAPRASERELEMCARCHSRRGLFHEDYVHGQPVSDDYRVALLDDDLYYADGQVKGEVYEYGSFLQSRMFAEGVTCSDCHDPHRPELRGAGDSVCLKCHDQKTYFSSRHHFHKEGSPAARCVSCHMPQALFMVVDARRDHSLRVPRPDLSVKLGVPNPCNGCHADRSPRWAKETVEKWYHHAPSGLQQFAEALASGSQGAPGAQQLLAALIADRGQPSIARASALARLAHPLSTPTLARVRDALADESSLVRREAVRALADADPRLRALLLSPLAADPVRSVRLEAASALAGAPAELLAPDARAALTRATGELIAAQELNGDRPEAHLNLANLYASLKRPDDAESELERALSLDPTFVPAAVNLADLYRTIGRDDAGERVLRAALERVPKNPSLLHTLGLVRVRQHRLAEAIDPLGAAAHLAPDTARYGFVYAVALHDAGRRDDAVSELDAVLARSPYDRDSLAALVAFCREAGDLERARAYAGRLEALER